jgi:hypothetical protein
MSVEEQHIRSLGASAGVSAEEQSVRMMYSKLALLTQLHVVSNAAMSGYVSSHGVIDDIQMNSADLAKQLSDASVDFQLSDFKVGPLSEIMANKWANYLTLPQSGQEMLVVALKGHDFGDDNQPRARWQTAAAQWQAAPLLTKRRLLCLTPLQSRKLLTWQTV